MISEKRNLLTKLLIKNFKNSDLASKTVSNILEMPIPYLIINEFHNLVIKSQKDEFNFKNLFNNPVKFQSMYAIYVSVVNEFQDDTKENIALIKNTFFDFFERNKDDYTNEMLKIERLFNLEQDNIENSFSEAIDYNSQPFGEVLKSLIASAAKQQQINNSVANMINDTYKFFEENKKV